MASAYVNPANAVTASRYLTLPPFLWFMSQGRVQLAWLMICISVAGDVLDGPVARYFNCSSGFGELFDAITDALCLGFYIGVATYYELVPYQPILVFLALGVINGLMRIVYTRRAGRTTNYRSWAMERLVAYTGALAGAAVTGYSSHFYAWVVPGVMFVIVAWDAKRMLFDPIPEASAKDAQPDEELADAV